MNISFKSYIYIICGFSVIVCMNDASNNDPNSTPAGEAKCSFMYLCISFSGRNDRPVTALICCINRTDSARFDRHIAQRDVARHSCQ